ncbi:MAG: packaged DNA stabilization gp4 family protein [Cellvibrionaceae bacterium]
MTFYVYDSGGSGSPFIVADYDIVSADTNTAPTITGLAAVSTPENQLNIAQYTIAERDGQTPTLTGTDAGLMELTNVSGDLYQLAWSSNPDFSVLGAGPHNVTINIDDGVNDAVTQAVAVTLTDTNTAPTLPNYTFSIAENVAIGTVVGTVVGVDRDTLTYSILSGNTNSDLAINSSTGAITTANALDYNATTQYPLVVQVSDGSLTGTGNVTVDVTDINYAPVFSGSYAFDVPEFAQEGYLVGQVFATGLNGSPVTFSALDNSVFLTSSDGKITLNNDLNFDNTPTIDYVVIADDGLAQSSTTVKLTLLEDLEKLKVGRIIRDALQEINVQESEQPLIGSEASMAIRYLNRMMMSWPSDIGYRPVDSIEDVICIPVYAEEAIVLNLAIRLAPQFDIPVSIDLRQNANTAYTNLLVRTTRLTQATYPAGIPMGRGYENTFYTGKEDGGNKS